MFSNFASAGGWGNLSDAEKKEYQDSYNKVPGHGDTEGFAFGINVNNQVAELREIEVDSKDMAQLSSLKTYKEFSVFMQMEIKRIRELNKKESSLPEKL